MLDKVLKLTVISYGGEPRSGLTKTFGPGRFTIGRGAGNDWVLADPEKHLSNRHCIIEGHDGRYSITDFSSNGVFVNGAEQALGHGCSSPIEDGDRVTIGDYQIAVEAAAPSAKVAPSALVPGTADCFSLDPFRARGPEYLFAAQNAPIVPPKLAPEGEVERAGESPLEPRLDPFPSTAGPAPGFTSFDIGHSAGPDPNHVPAVNSSFRVPEIKPPIIPHDWGALPADDPALPGNIPPAPFAAEGPANMGPQPGARPIETMLQTSLEGAAEPALRAFLEGAGLPEAVTGSADAETRLRAYGALFREFASGVRELLGTRALMKSEFRIPQTVIRQSGNNPLKFSVDLDHALQVLLAPKNTGYGEPLAAVREAIDDLKAHELGVIAGMQKAVAQLLGALAPEIIERRIEATGLLASLVPVARKARCWEAYEALYRELAADLAEDVRGAFSRSFAAAYSDQVEKL